MGSSNTPSPPFLTVHLQVKEWLVVHTTREIICRMKNKATWLIVCRVVKMINPIRGNCLLCSKKIASDSKQSPYTAFWDFYEIFLEGK